MDVLKMALWFFSLFFFFGTLSCTPITLNFFSYVQPNFKGGLECLDLENSRIETIQPDVNLPNTTSLIFQSCQLLKTTLIHQLINNLGLKRIMRLEFNFKNNNEITLSYFKFVDGFNLKDFILEDVQYIQKIKNDELDVSETTLPIELLPSRDKLQVLRLSAELTTLSENMLSNLINLKELDLQNNHLVVIPPAAVKNLANLESIDLRYNQLKNLTMRQFPNLKQLKYVNLSYNDINHMFFNTFKDNKNLEVVDLRNNPIFQLPDWLFSHFPKLIEVNLGNCKLTSLSNSIFYQSESLKTLDLGFNEITFLHESLFHPLTELKYLDLSSNKLSDFPKDIFLNLKKLKYLNLSYNNLTNLEIMETKSLSSLEKLDLKYNQLASMSIDFRFAKKLYTVNLSHNNLKKLALKSSSLKKINLSYNKLTTIGEWIFQIKDLIHLDASFNKITALNIDFFLQFTRLSTLNFSNNRISTIEFFDMERLEQRQHEHNFVIKLNKNSIKCDCRLTSFLRYFRESLNPIIRKRITIKADNLVCKSPENLKNHLVENLNPSTLTCPYDYFFTQKCSDVCDCYVRDDAIIADCENKNLTEVPILNLQRSHIVEVNLQNNFLISGPNHSMGYEDVTKLLLSNNNISNLAWMPPRLKTLTLDHNNFTVFDSKMSNLLNSLDLLNVSLGGNPWACTCSAKILHSYLSVYKSSKLIDIKSITCIENETKIIDLNVDELCESSYFNMISIYNLVKLMHLNISGIFLIFTLVSVLVFKCLPRKGTHPYNVIV